MAIGTPNLVGREEQLERSSRSLTTRRLPAVSVVAGDAGIGKTALWEAAVEEREGPRLLLVLSSRPSEAEARLLVLRARRPASGPSSPRRSPELPVPQRRALESALGLAEVAGSNDERLVAFGFLSAVRVPRRRRRCSSPSTTSSGWTSRRWHCSATRCRGSRMHRSPPLLTARGAVPGWLGRMEGVIELDLATAERRRAARAPAGPARLRLSEADPAADLGDVRGNPFFALELARALERRGGRIEPGEKLPVPETLEGLVLERLETLTPGSRRGLPGRCGSSDPTIELVERAPACRDGVEEALRGACPRARRGAPALHASAAGSAIAGRTVGARKRSLHERLAAVASDPEEQARHLALAASAPSTQVAAALDAAARRARADGLGHRCGGARRAGVALTPAGDDDVRRRRRLEAADLHFEAGTSSVPCACSTATRGGAGRAGARRRAPAARAAAGRDQRSGGSGRALAGGARRGRRRRPAEARSPARARPVPPLHRGRRAALAQLEEAVLRGCARRRRRPRVPRACSARSGALQQRARDPPRGRWSARWRSSRPWPSAAPRCRRRRSSCTSSSGAASTGPPARPTTAGSPGARPGGPRSRATPRGISRCSTGATAAGMPPPRRPRGAIRSRSSSAASRRRSRPGPRR